LELVEEEETKTKILVKEAERDMEKVKV